MGKAQIVYLKTKDLHPYKNNPRINAQAVEAVAASISEFGFRSPIIIDEHNTVVNGHTRLKAAKRLGMAEVPCIKVTDLTEEQIREYRLIDNKTSEYSRWDPDMLQGELANLDFGGLDFDFDFSGNIKKPKKWEESKKRCNLKDHVGLHKAMDNYYQSLFKAGKDGAPLKELKVPENVHLFARTAYELIGATLGLNLRGWCLLTTPRRRHADEFHFATAVCEELAAELGIPFYPDTLVTENHNRTHPHFRLARHPRQRNVILYDDILTTGCTLNATRELLITSGYTVWSLISIDNH